MSPASTLAASIATSITAASARSLASPLRLALLALVAASLLLVACDGPDAAADEAEGGTVTPTVATSTVTGAGGAAGGGIEPANPDEPPSGGLNSDAGRVPLGLGTYCWSPPTGGGERTALCVDAVGIIAHGQQDLPVRAGEVLEVTGDLTWPPMYMQTAVLYPAPDEPLAAQDDFRAWSPLEGETFLDVGDHTLELPEDLPAGRYVLAVHYTAGPDRGSEATYGAVLVVE